MRNPIWKSLVRLSCLTNEGCVAWLFLYSESFSLFFPARKEIERLCSPGLALTGRAKEGVDRHSHNSYQVEANLLGLS